MFKNRHILIFLIIVIIELSSKAVAKKKVVQKKGAVVDEKNINKTIPIPMISKTFISHKKAEYQASPKYKLGVCLIGKNFSSILERIFCFLNIVDNKTRHNFSTCDRKYRYKSLHKMRIAQKLSSVDKMFKKYEMLMIVRNPIDRLISGFMQLCYFRIYLKPNEDYCYKCGKNLSCFINKLQDELWAVTRNEKIPNQFHDYHFYPQTWQCAYYKYKNNYKQIKYPSTNKTSFYNNLTHYLEKAGVPKNDVKFLDKKMRFTKTYHVTNSRDATKIYRDALYNNTSLLRQVCAIFYHDFIEFGFDSPSQCDQSKNITIS
uniref:Sulfotransferase domain-containing protein n=1 Tax=Strongyloides stercoralis TaxID=6248 RepID=A0A0K0EJB7_STRER